MVSVGVKHHVYLLTSWAHPCYRASLPQSEPKWLHLCGTYVGGKKYFRGMKTTRESCERKRVAHFLLFEASVRLFLITVAS